MLFFFFFLPVTALKLLSSEASRKSKLNSSFLCRKNEAGKRCEKKTGPFQAGGWRTSTLKLRNLVPHAFAMAKAWQQLPQQRIHTRCSCCNAASRSGGFLTCFSQIKEYFSTHLIGCRGNVFPAGSAHPAGVRACWFDTDSMGGSCRSAP